VGAPLSRTAAASILFPLFPELKKEGRNVINVTLKGGSLYHPESGVCEVTDVCHRVVTNVIAEHDGRSQYSSRGKRVGQLTKGHVALLWLFS
jgi:hypothetical protein